MTTPLAERLEEMAKEHDADVARWGRHATKPGASPEAAYKMRDAAQEKARTLREAIGLITTAPRDAAELRRLADTMDRTDWRFAWLHGLADRIDPMDATSKCVSFCHHDHECDQPDVCECECHDRLAYDITPLSELGAAIWPFHDRTQCPRCLFHSVQKGEDGRSACDRPACDWTED